ncbi:MAG: hypothetical protein QOH32_3741 [Bradyrhizobium sp.]|jgi:uncharacterized protein involved in exopolysaccharide biosynthesis|nr:hypothetical protein [Bradyrhizobium sp.]
MSEKRIVPVELAPKAEPHGGDEVAHHSTLLFLDALAFLVERWKFILTTTLIAGMLAYGVTLLLPKVYTSVAYLGPMDENFAKSNEVLIQSAPVLDTVIGNFPQYRPGYSLEDRREYLASRLGWKIAKGSTPKSAMYTLSLDNRDPHLAQSMLNAILDRWLETLAPRPDTSDRLTKTLEASETQANDLSQVISELKKRPDAMLPDLRTGYYPPNVTDMIKMRTETAAKIVELTQQLRAGTRDLIFRAPDLPGQPSGPRKMIIVTAAVTVALCGSIAFFLIYWGLSRVAGRPAYARVFARLHRAIPW